jgi:ABC-type transport system substrate-binding protein
MKGPRPLAWRWPPSGVCVLGLRPMAWGAEPKPGGTLRVAWEAEGTGFAPGFSRGLQAYYRQGNSFTPLVTVDADVNFVPELAESWEPQENGKVSVVHLRHGGQFHDGTGLPADAVRWHRRWARALFSSPKGRRTTSSSWGRTQGIGRRGSPIWSASSSSS